MVPVYGTRNEGLILIPKQLAGSDIAATSKRAVAGAEQHPSSLSRCSRMERRQNCVPKVLVGFETMSV